MGGINTFVYALDNPVRYTDPSGLAVPGVIAACLADPPCAAALGAGAAATGKLIGDTLSGILGNIGDAANDDISDHGNPGRSCNFLLATVDDGPTEPILGCTQEITCIYRCPTKGLRKTVQVEHFPSSDPAAECAPTVAEDFTLPLGPNDY